MADFEIEALLQKTVGLKVSSASKATLERAVRRRMTDLAIGDKDEYVRKLKSSRLELQELIEEIIIPETWFFRNREPFKAMVQYLAETWSPKYKGKKLKVLSVPCASGEEPYSLTISLLRSGWPAEKFSVHGVDISRRSIARAKEGVYSMNSFRGNDLSHLSRYFHKTPPYYVLSQDIRDKVHFHTGNILDQTFMQALGRFDVIFFRNVLIYFNSHSIQQAIATLERILSDDGILFVGHAETNLFLNSNFSPAPFKGAFAFLKVPAEQIRREAEARTAAKPRPAKAEAPVYRRPASSSKKTKDIQPDLDQARKYADSGKLQKATAICTEYLKRSGPSAQVFFLLGLLHDAADDSAKAEHFFRKALYLDPKHEESLVFLALLVDKKGENKEANTLKNRIERLQEKTDSRHNNI